VLPLSNRLLKELGDYWRAQRQGKWGHDIPWLFLGYRGEPICTTSGQNIFYRAVKSSSLDFQAPRARCGASAAERCGQIDVLSVVRKSRN
ncbi:hypothetical protein Q8G41_27710, partial [Klebsiella pneumoniae]|uniref:hypothetical protein n=1 Tax=Klebsiella pneumoniae TaxID=573 RepID=UPI0030138D6F